MQLISCMQKVQELSRPAIFLARMVQCLLSVFSRLSGYRNEYVGLGKTWNRASVLSLSNE
jgi:hypothetical protein